MRYGSKHKQQTHDKIVAAGARLFRARGFDAAGVDAVMSAAGLTAGGFYAHFKNKDALLAEVMEQCFRDAPRSCVPDSSAKPSHPLHAWLDGYLSARHRDAPAAGCPLPALAGELPRQAKKVRTAFTATFAEQLQALADRMPTGTPQQRLDAAIRTLSAAAGAIMLARAVDDPLLSDSILNVVRESLKSELSSPRPRARTRRPARRPQ